MSKLFLFGALAGIGFGLFKFFKKNTKNQNPAEAQVQG